MLVQRRLSYQFQLSKPAATTTLTNAATVSSCAKTAVKLNQTEDFYQSILEESFRVILPDSVRTSKNFKKQRNSQSFCRNLLLKS